MFLTVQRVRSPDGTLGVNGFVYLQPGRSPQGVSLAELEQAPGALAFEQLSLPPGENRVCSYLDVLVPEGLAPDEGARLLARAAQAFAVHARFPAQVQVDSALVRFGCVRRLAQASLEEVEALAQALMGLWREWEDSGRAVVVGVR